jgi:thiosulfate/3-mercaptopyruvate sulfurtransferase
VITSSGKSDSSLFFTTRLYWQLKYYGHDSVAILDGGNIKWNKEKREMDIPIKPKKGNFEAIEEKTELLARTEDVKKALDSKIQLIDARDEKQYIGLFHKSYVFKYGHISGAKSFDATLLTTNGKIKRFQSLDVLKKVFTIKGIEYKLPTITYCNSGYIASSVWFVIYELLDNKNIKLYDGSMHEWTSYKDNPTENYNLYIN